VATNQARTRSVVWGERDVLRGDFSFVSLVTVDLRFGLSEEIDAIRDVTILRPVGELIRQTGAAQSSK